MGFGSGPVAAPRGESDFFQPVTTISGPSSTLLSVRYSSMERNTLAAGARCAWWASSPNPRSSSASWIISESARRSLARLRTPRSRSPAPCEICLSRLSRRTEKPEVSVRDRWERPHKAFDLHLSPRDVRPGGRPAVEIRPRVQVSRPVGRRETPPTGRRKSNRLSFLSFRYAGSSRPPLIPDRVG